MDNFTLERTFYDITDSVGLSANQTKKYDASGLSADGRNYMTPGTVTSSGTNGATVREISSIEIIPPQNSDGAYEDLREVSIYLDGHPYRHYVLLSGYGPSLMTPYRTQIWGGQRFLIRFGVPLWKAITSKIPNMPLAAICPKFARNMTLEVSSVYGVTGAGSGGFRIIVKGFEYTIEELTLLAPGWTNGVGPVQTLRRDLENGKGTKPALQFTFEPSGTLSYETWTSYPGGPAQGTIKVNPYWRFAYNAKATDPNRFYAFTNNPNLGGQSGYVEDDFQDLGLEFNLSNNAMILRGFGAQPVPLPPGQTGAPGVPGENLAYVGWFINGNLVPEEIGNDGVFVTPNLNPLGFGAIGQYVAMKNVFLPIPPIEGQPELIYKDNFVPYMQANGSSIPADSVVMAMNGVLVEQA